MLVQELGSGVGAVGRAMTMLDCDRWGRPRVQVVLSDSTITAISWMEEGQVVLLSICHISLLYAGYLGIF
jgi:hypothetical protein